MTMSLSSIYIVTFSPTRTSFRVAEAIARGTAVPRTEIIDLTRVATPPVKIPADTLAILSFPVYGGKIPPVAVERLRALHGNNTPAVVSVTYGNRHYDGALEQLAFLAREQGFRILAAASFIGEHSYSTQAYPVAEGRPNANDLQMAHTFGRDILAKLTGGQATEIDVRSIAKPAQPLWPTIRFIWKVIRFRRSGAKLQAAPLVQSETDCTRCGRCVRLCPTAAISAETPWQTDPARCIRCCACVKGCPAHVRHYETPFSRFLSGSYSAPKQPQFLL